MARIIIICIILSGFHRLYGQSFTAEPGVLLEKTILFNAANDCYIHFEDNISIDTFYLKWRLVESSIPQGWDIDLCDYATCYEGIPTGKKMYPATDTIQPYLKLIAQPGNTPGEAWLWFRVTNQNDPLDFIDVYFDLVTPGITGIDNADDPAGKSFFPNPVSHLLYSKNISAKDGLIQITRLDGRVYWEGEFNNDTPLETSSWPPGCYLISGNGIHQVLMHY